jgi:4-carboxymuconolactone decarboxylase
MDERERHEAGMKVRRQVAGEAHVDRVITGTSDMTREFQDLITRYAFGEIWSRPGLDIRTRRILVIGTLLAIGRWEEFRTHVRLALGEGRMPPEEIKEILLQQAIYCGVPAANTGFLILEEEAKAAR